MPYHTTRLKTTIINPPSAPSPKHLTLLALQPTYLTNTYGSTTSWGHSTHTYTTIACILPHPLLHNTQRWTYWDRSSKHSKFLNYSGNEHQRWKLKRLHWQWASQWPIGISAEGGARDSQHASGQEERGACQVDVSYLLSTSDQHVLIMGTVPECKATCVTAISNLLTLGWNKNGRLAVLMPLTTSWDDTRRSFPRLLRGSNVPFALISAHL